MWSRHNRSSASVAISAPGRHDKGHDLLAPLAMRAPHHRNLDEVGMAQQYLLDLARIDVAAAADDHVLRAVAQGQKAGFVKAAEIAGMQPAAAQCLVRRFRVLPIAFHHAIALRDDLTDLAGRQLAVAIVDDLDEDPGARHAARPEPLAPMRMVRVGVHALVEPSDRHRRLALTIELVEARGEETQGTIEG